MSRSGNNRRRHVVFVTQHTEYHCRNRECVGVRDRRTGQWKRWHGVLRTRLVGATWGSRRIEATPQVGQRLLFVGGQSVLTSPVQQVLRPEHEAIWSYSSRCTSGAIEASADPRTGWRHYRWLMAPSVEVASTAGPALTAG